MVAAVMYRYKNDKKNEKCTAKVIFFAFVAVFVNSYLKTLIKLNSTQTTVLNKNYK